MTEKNKTDETIDGLGRLYNLTDLSEYRFNRSILSDAAEEIQRLRKERDEARRMSCRLAAQHLYDSDAKILRSGCCHVYDSDAKILCISKHCADNWGWDCYKKDETK